MKSREIDMTTGRTFTKILLFAGPLILAGILQCLYNAADIIVIGRFAGEAPLAAVGATASLISLITNMFIGLSVGTAITVSIAIGARNTERIRRLVHTSIAIACVAGIAVTAIGFFGAQFFLELMKTPDDILDMATTYLRIYFLGSVPTLLYNYGAAVIRSAGDSRRPLYYLAVSGIINVFLNLFFVIVCHMTVDGVAIATVIAQTVSAACVIVQLLLRRDACRLSIAKLRFHGKELLDILRTGIPAGIQSVVFSISNTIIQAAINGFDTFAVAGNTSGSNIDGFIYTAMYAMHTTAVTAVGQNVGAGKPERIRRILFQCLLTVVMISVILGGIVLIFMRPLLRIYLPNSPESVEFGVIRLTILVSTYFLCGIMDTVVGVSRGMGQTLLPMVMSVTGVCGIRLVWIATIFRRFHTLAVLYVSYPISWAVTAAIQLVACFVILKRLMKNKGETPALS